MSSAVRSTTTERPISGRSSATTFCIITHCSEVAPGGVSQMMDQAPWVDFTLPLGCAASAWPAPIMPARKTTFAKVPETRKFMSAPFPNHDTLTYIPQVACRLT
ncbi:hypothetical protein ATER59S_03829 [Aquamicrobium terrae]